LSIIGSGGINISGSTGNNTVTIGASIPSSLTDLSISDGTTGQFLKTDGAGNFSFDTPESGASVSVSDSAPDSPSAGDLWFDSSDLKMYIYYNDGSSQQWIDVSGSADLSGFATTTQLDNYLEVANTNLFATTTSNTTFSGTVNFTNTLLLNGTSITANAEEINYTDGVTSNIQTQLDIKASTGKAIAMAIVFGG